MKRTALRRVTPLRTTKLAGKRPRDTGPDAQTRALVMARAQGRCERCGCDDLGSRWDGFSVHHRLPRSRGGGNGPENLLVLCGSGTSGCHGFVESYREAAYECRLLLRTGQDPASEPVFLRSWFRLTPAGTKVPA